MVASIPGDTDFVDRRLDRLGRLRMVRVTIPMAAMASRARHGAGHLGTHREASERVHAKRIARVC